MRSAAVALLTALLVGTTQTRAAEDQAWIENARIKYDIPGVVVGVVQRGKPAQFYSAGLCNVELATPCTEKHRLPIGSVTKSITALLMAKLAAEQKIDLDVPVIQYWPELKLPDARTQEVTIRDLLTQRSGLGSIDWPYFWDGKLTRQQYLERLESVPPARAFRSGFAYANANFIVAGKVLENVTHQSWESLVTKSLLVPLGMSRSGFDAPASNTVGYGPNEAGRLEPFPYFSPVAIHPAGGLVTTAEDYSHLIEAMLNEGKWKSKEIVSPKAIKTAFSNGDSKRRGGYGLGLGFTTFRDQLVYHHLGSMAGYSAAVLFVPEQWGVIVLTNRTGSEFPEALAFALLDRHLGHDGDEPLLRFAGPPVPSTETKKPRAGIASVKDAAKFLGSYRNVAWGEFTVEASGENLQIRFSQFAARLEYMKGTTFDFLTAPGWERIKITFQQDADGNVAGFAMADGSNPDLQQFIRITSPNYLRVQPVISH